MANAKKKQEGYYASIKRRDPAARNSWAIFWLYPSVRALRWYKLSHFFWKIHFKFLAEMIMHHASRTTGIEIHPAAKIGRNLFIDHGQGVIIGETAVIGDDVTLYHGVTLGGHTYNKVKRHPTIGDHVVIGTGAKILGPITIGDYAKVAPNVVIRHDVPACHTAFGDKNFRPNCHNYDKEENPDSKEK
jgi:serine O-acetyltransferase